MAALPPMALTGALLTVLLGATASVAYATHADAIERGVAPWGWTLVAVAATPVAAWYWLRRETYGARTAPLSTVEQVARAVALATAASLFVTSILLPPDIGTTAVGMVVGTALGTPVVYLLSTGRRALSR